jgi:hypothetical protein
MAQDEMVRHALLAFAAAVLRDEIMKKYPPLDNEWESPQSKKMLITFAEHVGHAIKSLKSQTQKNALVVAVTLFLLGFASVCNFLLLS